MNPQRRHLSDTSQTGEGFLTQLTEPLSEVLKNWVSTLSLREQVLVKALAFIVALYVAWSFAVAPALSSLNKSTLKDQTLKRQWYELLAVQGELKTIKSLAPIGSSDAGAALSELTTQLGPQAKISIQDSTARMQIKAVSPEALTQLFTQIRNRSQAQILEASLKLDGQSKLWEGSLTLALPSLNTNIN